VPECPLCGRIIKSGEKMCVQCRDLTSPGLRVDTEAVDPASSPDQTDSCDFEEAKQVDEQGPLPVGEIQELPGDSHDEIPPDAGQLPENCSLGIETDLVKAEPSPFDDFMAEESRVQDQKSEDLVSVPISEQMEPQKKVPESDESAKRPQPLGLAPDPGNSTDKIYVLSDQAISSKDREKLISSLHSKIPGIMKMKQDSDQDAEPSKKNTWEATLARAAEDDPDKDKVEELSSESVTEILTPLPSFEDEIDERVIYAQGSALIFPQNVKLRSGDEVIHLGRKYKVKTKPKNRKGLITGLAAGMLALIIAVLILLPLLSSKDGKLVGLVVSADGKTVVPDAQVTINELGRTAFTDQHGLFYIDDIASGDWTVSAAKSQFRHAALGFSQIAGQTSILTIRMEPVVVAAPVQEAAPVKEEK